jgi:hypothetical protein
MAWRPALRELKTQTDQWLSYVRFRASERLSGYAAERQKFERAHGYPLDLKHPRSFNEKICWRKIYDRNRLFPRVSDKLAAREYVREILGTEEAARLLIPLIHHTRDPGTLPFSTFPDAFAIKANHGSGMNILVLRRDDLDENRIVDQCQAWLRTSFGRYNHEWAYRKIRPSILVEALVAGPGGGPPTEYKLHMFSGKCHLIQVHECSAWYDRYSLARGPLPTVTNYSKTWNRSEMAWGHPPGPAQPAPPNLDEMLSIAARLSRPLDYVRVDFYLAASVIRLGELTLYHHSGRSRIRPVEFDFALGDKWTLPAERMRARFWKP